ncbi:hypothetical protein LMG28138_05902 [Pararobbsia alpina]|uniref:Uncharacterized protein n=1 Tax=Pararobbsia alpina TaxID=621374 RepID=A0A6S7CE41_9BURK|nr:hypothetical protein LMG28138_05902 [Pararobbsia alpina]
MLDTIISFFKSLLHIYDALPDEHRNTIKEKLSEAFDPLFRDFYRSDMDGNI